LLITAHVFKHTFDVGMATGVSLALGLMVLTLLAIEAVVPTTPVRDAQLSLFMSDRGMVVAQRQSANSTIL